MADIYVYELDGNLYINLTNRCSNNCEFCVRNKPSYFSYDLRLDKEPSARKVIKAAGDVSKYKEIVFCGFGEPTYKLRQLLKIGRYFKKKGKYVRLNTNGQGNLINGKDITKELARTTDAVNISLNESCAQDYQEICESIFGLKAYGEIIKFADKCKRNGIKTVFSIVDIIGSEKIEKCRKIAQETGVELKIRAHIK